MLSSDHTWGQQAIRELTYATEEDALALRPLEILSNLGKGNGVSLSLEKEAILRNSGLAAVPTHLRVLTWEGQGLLFFPETAFRQEEIVISYSTAVQGVSISSLALILLLIVLGGLCVFWENAKMLFCRFSSLFQVICFYLP